MTGIFDSIPEDAPHVGLRGSDFWLHDGVILGKTRPRAPHGGFDDAVRAVDAIRTLTHGSRLPLVFDARHVGWLQIKAWEHIHRSAAELFTGAGVIVRPAAERLFSRAFVGAVRVEIPVKLFAEEEAAWGYATESLSQSS